MRKGNLILITQTYEILLGRFEVRKQRRFQTPGEQKFYYCAGTVCQKRQIRFMAHYKLIIV